MFYFRVLYDFNGTDQMELTVAKGALVRAESSSAKDGWMLVELADDAARKGFVPQGYLRQTDAPMRSAVEPTSGPPRSMPAVSGSFQRSALSVGVSMQHDMQHPVVTPPAEESVNGIMASSAIPNPSAVLEGFMKNEIFYRKLLKQRHDAMAKIEGAIAEATTELSVCRDKNAQMSRKLRDLDDTIQKERTKWNDRVNEERMLLAQRSAAPLQSMTHLTNNTATGSSLGYRSM
jgi:hypothetical protein